MFGAYELRTTDVAAAEAFYAAVVGGGVRIARLPEQAAARGAPAHWLGSLVVPDVEVAVARMLALGGQRLGPPASPIVRDPLGSVVAFAASGEPGRVAWHELHTTDAARAWAIYGEGFGWTATGSYDPGLGVGPYRTFAWTPGGASVGGLVESARRPGVHPHWLFYLAVPDLERALAAAIAGGAAHVHGPQPGPTGARVAALDDPQGAAIGLVEA